MRGMPEICGVIERRILVAVRIRPEIASGIIPRPLVPRIVNGWSIGGVCLIRLGDMGLRCTPRWMKLRSENAAHRFAVQWLEDGQVKHGVYVPDRETDSHFSQLMGGRLFPGVHHRAKFSSWESEGRFRVGFDRQEGDRSLKLVARIAGDWPAGSVFRSLAEASAFYHDGTVGWSICPGDDGMHGMQLSCDEWKMKPLLVERLESSFFQDHSVFPAGSVEFDSACLMRRIRHSWKYSGYLKLERESNNVGETSRKFTGLPQPVV